MHPLGTTNQPTTLRLILCTFYNTSIPDSPPTPGLGVIHSSGGGQSVVDIMILVKLFQNKEKGSVKVTIGKSGIENRECLIGREMIFETEDKSFTEGDFSMTYTLKSNDESIRGKSRS